MKHTAFLLFLAGCGATDMPRTDTQSADKTSADMPSADTVRATDADGVMTVTTGSASVHVDIEGEADADERAAILVWTKDAMRAVTSYYGRFPVDNVRLVVTMKSGSDIDSGVTRVWNGKPVITMPVGSKTTTATFAADWVLTHEMVHTAFPDLAERHHWLEEGLATYIEPIARARVGLESDADVWKQLVEGLPKGQPRRNDRGLDHTPTWGRTYWGGALFCLLADVGIRERTENRFGLRDALVALVADGWTIEKDADVEAVFARMDHTVGVPVLSELYAQHAAAGVRTDLDGLWKRLGIAYDHGRVTFDDSAPEAALRRAITH